MHPEVSEKDDVAADFDSRESYSDHGGSVGDQFCQVYPVTCFSVGQCLEECFWKNVLNTNSVKTKDNLLTESII